MEQNEKQIRKLREQADKARQSGNTRKALELFHELCKAEPGEPRWPQLCGEFHRKLGQLEESSEHFVAAARIYRTQGFDVKAVAVCKVLLGLDPLNAEGLNLLEEITSSPRPGVETAVPQTHALASGAQPAQAGARAQGSPSSAVSAAPEPPEPTSSDQLASPPRGAGAYPGAPASPPGPPPSGELASGAAPSRRRTPREASARELQSLDLSELEAMLGPDLGVTGESGGAVDRAPVQARAQVERLGAQPSPAERGGPASHPVQGRPGGEPSPRTTLDLAIEIEGYDSVLGAESVSGGASAPDVTRSPARTSGPSSTPVSEPARPSAPAASTPRKRARETLTLSEDELEFLELGAIHLGEEDGVPQAVVGRPRAEPEPGPEPAPPKAAHPTPSRPQAPSEEDLEILDDSDLAFMEALEKSSTGEQKQAKKRPTLTPNAPLESLELKDVMPRLERLPSQPHMDELYEIELEIEEADVEANQSRPVETADYQRRLTPAKPPPDMTPPGLFRALGIDATKSLVTRMSFVDKKAGEVVIRQGEVGGSLFVIVRGEVRIVKELGEERVEVSRLGEGEFFGEMALVTDTPRVATVEAVTDIDLLEVSRETLRLLIQDFPQVVPNLIKFLKDRLLEVFVKTSDFLRPVPEKYRWQLARKFKLYEIHEGKTILREGKPSGGMFIFLAGQAGVTRQRRGRTVELAELGPGALIGELSLLGGGDAMATVTAKTKCWLLAISQKQFEVLCLSYPQMRSFVEEVAERRRQENARILAGERGFVSQELRLI